MLTPSPRAWRRLLVLAGLLATLLVPTAAAAADATATMTVRARVVDSCRIRLPDPVPPHVRDRVPDHVPDLIEHRCRRPVHPRITAGPLPRRLIERHRPRDVAAQRHPGRNHVLITLTY